MIGQTISHYKILEKLGEGGMGVVYKARDTHLDRFVALKILPAEKVADPDRRLRFVQEAKAASALNHPHIVTIHDIDEADGVHFIAMEYVDGKTLDQLIPRHGMRLNEALKVAVQMADALAAAHEAGIVHRDLKPGNLMVTEKGLVKVLDFGLAKLTEKLPISAEDATLTAKPDTEEGKILGTVAYMSPEQAEGKKVDARSDIFSFGSVLYEMVTGQNAFQGSSKMSTLSAILFQEPKPINTLIMAIPDELEKLISRCLRKDPARRIQHMDDIKVTVADLKEELDSGRLQVVPAGAKPKRARVEHRSSRMLVALGSGLLIAAVLAVGAGWWLMRHREAQPSSGNTVGRITSLAVKPLDDYSGDAAQSYLSDGMTEALCNALGSISALRVPGRPSVMRFKGSQKSIQEMARELNVDALVAGSIQLVSNRIRVTVQLVEAATDRQLWSTNYNRDFSDFFVVQDEVAKAIAAEVQVRLTPEDRGRLARARPIHPDAIDAYLRGMQQWWRWTDEGTMNALGYLRRAVEIEPNYSQAQAGLALTCVSASTFIGLLAPTNVLQGKDAAEKAIKLDPMLADAFVARGYARLQYDWDWRGAEMDFTNALALSPHSSVAADGYSTFLVQRERFNEAIAVARKALELDPRSPGLYHDVGIPYWGAGQFDQAIPLFRKALDLDRDVHTSRLFLGWCYLFTGRSADALAEFQTLVQLAPDWPWSQAALGHAFAVTGRRAEALQLLAHLGQLRQKRYVSHCADAFVCLGLGQTNVTLDHLEQAYKERDSWVPWLRFNHGFAPLRNEPRFQALLQKVENGGRDP